MSRRAKLAHPLDRGRFPLDPWRLVESVYREDDLGLTETLFTVANGYLGMRGNPEEGRDAIAHGTFINGFHETWPIRHAEAAFGFARTGQTIVNVPDAKLMKLYVDDEPLILGTSELESYERSLDFRDGVLRRSLVWRTPSGKQVLVESTRMVSMTQRHLAVLTLEVTMLNGDAPIVISSQLLNRQDGQDEYYVPYEAMGEGTDPRKAAAFDERVLVPRAHYVREDRMLLGYMCAQSRMTIAVAADHHLETVDERETILHSEDDLGKMVFRVEATAGQQGPAAEAGDLPHLARRTGPRALRPLRPDPRPRRAALDRGLPRRAAGLVRRVLGRQRRRGGRRGDAAGDPLQHLLPRPGQRPRRSPGRARQGSHRAPATRATTSGTRRSTSSRS